jgi:ribosomal protein S18 acetylase RimI-like enzyme
MRSAACLIQRLDHRQPATAEQIRGLLQSAHAQESKLIGAEPGPVPSLQQIQLSLDVHLGALEGGALVGVVVIGPSDDPGQLELKSLAVAAGCQRRGIASALLGQVFAAGGASFGVTVAQANAGALALYRGMGFAAHRCGALGVQGIPVLRLRRP